MKKRFFGIPLYYFLLLAGVGLLGLIVGTFADWSISSALADTSHSLGKHMENFGMTLGFMMIPLGGSLIFLGLKQNKVMALKILGYVFLLIGIGAGTYFTGHNSTGSSAPEFSFAFPAWLSYLLAFLLCVLVSVLTILFIKTDNPSFLIRLGAALLLTMLIQYLLLSFLKNLACRPRYRYIISPSLHPEEEVTFRAWYQFAFEKPVSDSFKSFPSGHTGTAGVILLLPGILPVLKKQPRWAKPLLYSLSIVSTLFVMYCRVRYGAHYLSDVSFSLLLVSLLQLLFVWLTNTLFVKKEVQQHEVETC